MLAGITSMGGAIRVGDVQFFLDLKAEALVCPRRKLAD